MSNPQENPQEQNYYYFYDDINELDCYTYDKYIVFHCDNDKLIGIYNKELDSCDIFGIQCVVDIRNFDYHSINENNVYNFDYIIIRVCDCCDKSRNENYENEFGYCSC